MNRIVLTLLATTLGLCSYGPPAEVDSLEYTVLMDGSVIGSYDVNQTSIGSATNLKVRTETSAGLIGRLTHEFKMMSSFDKDKFVSADLTTWVNGEIDNRSIIHWDGNQYIKTNGDKLTEICLDMVDYCSTSLFFEEPKNRSNLFYEKYGKTLPIRAIADHKYEIKLPNGSVEQYTYVNGKMEQMEIIQTFAVITLKLN